MVSLSAMRIAIFHDYIGAIGGGEKLVLTLARGLGADVITTDVDEDSVKKMGFEYVNIISLGGTVKLPPLKQISASLRFANAIFLRSMIFLYFQETGRIMRREGISRIFLQICEILHK